MSVQHLKPGVRIRRAGELDGFALVAMQSECLPYDDPISTDTGEWWIAEDALGPCAFASLHQSVRWRDTRYLSRAGVLPRARGLGLQRRLIRVRAVRAKRTGARWLISDTNENPVSANNLIACGFRMLAPSQPWALPTSLYWSKKLC